MLSQSKANARTETVTDRAISHWNSLPCFISQEPTANGFKLNLKRFMRAQRINKQNVFPFIVFAVWMFR